MSRKPTSPHPLEAAAGLGPKLTERIREARERALTAAALPAVRPPASPTHDPALEARVAAKLDADVAIVQLVALVRRVRPEIETSMAAFDVEALRGLLARIPR